MGNTYLEPLQRRRQHLHRVRVSCQIPKPVPAPAVARERVALSIQPSLFQTLLLGDGNPNQGVFGGPVFFVSEFCQKSVSIVWSNSLWIWEMQDVPEISRPATALNARADPARVASSVAVAISVKKISVHCLTDAQVTPKPS